MRAAVRCLPFLPALIAGSGCSGGGITCRPTFEYRISVDVSTVARVSCQVDFQAGMITASYAFQPLPPQYLQPCFEQKAQPACEPLAGSPQPTWCEASVCSIDITFNADVAHNLSAFMGADSFTMQATC